MDLDMTRFIKSIKVQNRKWRCSDWHRFVPIFCHEGDAIFVEMNLKFSLSLKLFQNLFLWSIGYIQPLNRFEFLELIGSDIYRGDN